MLLDSKIPQDHQNKAVHVDFSCVKKISFKNQSCSIRLLVPALIHSDFVVDGRIVILFFISILDGIFHLFC